MRATSFSVFFRFAAPLLVLGSVATRLCGAIPSTLPRDMPQIVDDHGRHALLVDGEPFLILGGQCHNSSAWPSTLPAVWSAIERMHANTLEAPVYWEQFEPAPGRFDPSLVDTMLHQAREHHVRLVLLWFGTWKNGSPHYLPLWMKSDPQTYPRMVGRDGKTVDSASPHAAATLEADRRAFSALMRHLKDYDPQHTVIMVQVENEPGTWGSVRDFSPAAEKLFEDAVPVELLQRLRLADRVGDNWRAVFGDNADEYFHAWSVARYINQVADAGKRVYPLPMYVNVALRDPLTNPPAAQYESGGATDNVLAIWKTAAPLIDVLAPDIYLPDPPRYLKVLDLYSQPDNPLFVPETIGSPVVSRFCYAALAHGAIGWSPFGIDGPPHEPVAGSDPYADALPTMYTVLGANLRSIAKLAYEGRLHAAIEQKGSTAQSLMMGRWQATTTFGPRTFGYGRVPGGNAEPVGRALIGQLGDNEFLVTGYMCRVDFKLAAVNAVGQREFVRVEEGSYVGGSFHPTRIWNGDETDWGLNFGTDPQLLRVVLGTF